MAFCLTKMFADGEDVDVEDELVDEIVVVDDDVVDEAIMDFGAYPPDVPLETPVNVICGHCGIDNATIAELLLHHDEHGEEEFAAICVVCAEIFDYAGICQHYAEGFRCAVCCRTFVQLNDWRRHNWTHSVLCRYRCPVCDLATNQLSDLTRHINSAHQVAGQAE